MTLIIKEEKAKVALNMKIKTSKVKSSDQKSFNRTIDKRIGASDLLIS
jgi:hypothetical protein